MNYPIIIFIDSFNIYRNTRRLIIGIYQIPAGLLYSHSSNKRVKNANIFPIILGLHTTNFDAIINAIGYLILLDKGIIIEIQGRPIVVSVFTIYYIGDMPQ